LASTFLSVATALPEHRLDAAARQMMLQAVWPRMAMVGDAIAEAGGDRYLVLPPEQLLEPRGLTETMAVYAEQALALAATATTRALESAGVKAAEVDAVISVSCTGYLVPSLDVLLIEQLGFRSDVIRLPITELGCSGGAAGIAFAHRHLAAFPRQRVLVVAVELPSLTFQPGDSSLDNLTASMVFGDGAGAALLTGSAGAPRGLRVEAVASHLVPGSRGSLGFDLRDDGFHVVLDRRLPRLIGRTIADVALRFMDTAALEAIDFLAAHGGGPRVLDAVQAALGLPEPVLAASRKTYAEVGNVSSASILFTLASLLPELGPAPREGLGVGLGPGVSIELMRLAWRP